MRANVKWPFFIILSVSFLFFTGCRAKSTEEDVFQVVNVDELTEAFEEYEIIGEGTHFLTVKIDLSQTLPSSFQVYGVVLDEDGYPLAKVSGYTHDPRLKGKNHLWFYFFIYAPGEWPRFLSESGHIQFIVARDDDVMVRKVVAYRKSWGGEDEAKIFDLPSPPDEIPGYMILKDYTFLAKNDYRKPQGYYVEGKIAGKDGEWTRFIAQSDIRGQEEEPEIKIEVDRGWLELTTGKSHSMPEAIAPSPPYIKGWWDGKGYFHPQPVQVVGLRLDEQEIY
jgi:hypothetical protein